jgi:Ca2+-binding RTX toxin-like protein
MRLVAGTALASLALAGVVSPDAGVAATKCNLDGKTLRVAMTKKHDLTVMRVDGGEILVEAQGPVACAAGTPTTTNTDRIRVRDRSAGNTDLLVSLSGGDFAPGATNAGDKDPDPFANPNEIEWSVKMGAGADDEFKLLGKPEPDGVNVRLGADGINVNVHTSLFLINDADIALRGAEDLLVTSGSGDDVVSAGGGAGTGTPLRRSLLLDDPFGGNDILTGGDGDDQIYNGGGSDTYEGGRGRDTLHYQGEPVTVTIGSGAGNDGGLDDLSSGIRDNLTAGGEDDFLVGSDKGNVLTGGKGVDTLRGLAGNDRLRAKDGTVDDEIDCSTGAGDSAKVDQIDPSPTSC